MPASLPVGLNPRSSIAATNLIARALLSALAFAFLVTTGSAWSQTPTLVQHYYSGSNAPPRGLNAPNYTFRLPNKTLAGNALVMFLDYPHGSLVSSIEDNQGNIWPISAAATADGGVGSPVTAVYVLPNAAAGTREIKVTFNTSVSGIHAAFLEYYNVDTSAAVGSTAARGNALAPTITSGALLPSAAASGNLVLNYAMDNEGQIGSQSSVAVTAWSAGNGWEMLGGDINNSHDTSSFALQARIADGTNFSPTMTATQSRADGFNSIAVELRAANAGTAPAAGIRIIKQQFYVHTALAVPGTWREFFPAQGNLLAAINIYHGSTTSPISDSNGNQWTQAHTDSGVPAMQYAQNAVTSPALAVTIPLTSANSNTTIVLFDIAGAASSGVLAQGLTVGSRSANGASTVTNAPSITPRNPDGLIIVATAFGQGPATGFTAGSPPSALFMPVTYPGETDLDTFDNADGYAHSYYGTDLSTQNYNWALVPQANNSFESAAVEFKAATGASATAPSGFTATATSTTQIDLAWTAPQNVAVTGYLVERCLGSSCTNFAEAAAVTPTTYSDTGLPASTTYRYRVRASLSDGTTTGYSNIATATTLTPLDVTPPSAPNLSATEVSASRIDLTWTAATDDVAVAGYRVERCQGVDCSALAQIATPPGTSFSDIGLAGETSYSYRVRAIDGAGNLGDYSNVASATTPKAPDTTPPSAPTGLSATAAGTSQINLAWIAATDNVGVTAHRLERCQGNNCSAFAEIAAPSGTSFNDTGLAAGTTYRYRARAVDAAGNLGGYSNVSSAATSARDTTPPSAPTGLSATAAGTSQINLAWTAATDNVGVTGHRLERCQGATCTTFAQIAAPSGTSFNDTGLAAGTSYRYRARAVDAAGNLGGYSNISSATTADTAPPSAPAGLSATAAGASQINLAWTAATDDVAVTGYRVERCQGVDCSAFAQIATPSGTSFSNTGLAGETSYSYRIRAVDAAGNLGDYSNVASATTPTAPDTTPPSAPTGLSATAAGTSQINLAWIAATDNVGVTGYRLERCEGAACTAFSQIAALSGTSFNDTGRTAGTGYRYRARAVDAAGNVGGYSNIAGATTTGTAPPSNIAFVQGNYATPQSPTATVSVRYNATQSSGDLNVIIVGWNDTKAVVTSITDSFGNAYAIAAAPITRAGNVSQVIYYAKNIVAATNGNIVTVRFSEPAKFADVRILSYSGLDRTSPLDVAVGAQGNSSSSDSGVLTTSSGNQLLVAGNTVWSSTTGPGAGFVSRFITSPDGDIAEDRVVTSTGSYRATAPLSGSGPWVMQMVTFKAASP